MLNKSDLEKLGELARIEIKKEEEEKLLNDLKLILNHFEELKEVDTSQIEPQSGGTFNTNVFREDEVEAFEEEFDLIKSFPSYDEKGNLIVPPIFEK
jgi:aspartyl-tRNA(Asn)/glutamyl-tRNA(Gln) amidotransferase subunit C